MKKFLIPFNQRPSLLLIGIAQINTKYSNKEYVTLLNLMPSFSVPYCCIVLKRQGKEKVEVLSSSTFSTTTFIEKENYNCTATLTSKGQCHLVISFIIKDNEFKYKFVITDIGDNYIPELFLKMG